MLWNTFCLMIAYKSSTSALDSNASLSKYPTRFSFFIIFFGSSRLFPSYFFLVLASAFYVPTLLGRISFYLFSNTLSRPSFSEFSSMSGISLSWITSSMSLLGSSFLRSLLTDYFIDIGIDLPFEEGEFYLFLDSVLWTVLTFIFWALLLIPFLDLRFCSKLTSLSGSNLYGLLICEFLRFIFLGSSFVGSYRMIFLGSLLLLRPSLLFFPPFLI